MLATFNFKDSRELHVNKHFISLLPTLFSSVLNYTLKAEMLHSEICSMYVASNTTPVEICESEEQKAFSKVALNFSLTIDCTHIVCLLLVATPQKVIFHKVKVYPQHRRHSIMFDVEILIKLSLKKMFFFLLKIQRKSLIRTAKCFKFTINFQLLNFKFDA